MKKTLIALLALAGVAVGAEPETGSLVLTNSNGTKTSNGKTVVDTASITTTVAATTTTWVKDVITLSGSTITITDASVGNSTTAGKYTGETNLNGYVIGDINVGNGDTDTDPKAYYVYSVSFSASEAITLSSIDVGFKITSAGGGDQSGRWVTYYWQLTSGTGESVTPLVNYSDVASWIRASSDGTASGTQSSTGTLTMNMGSTPITLDANTKYTLNLKITGVNNADANNNNAGGKIDDKGGFVHIGTITARVSQTIPEPTTATLSLLALAGLAARRRRK